MTIQAQYAIMHNTLNERQWRMYLGTESLKIGRGGISHVARLSKSDRKTIRKGIIELREPLQKHRIRKAGGGRKKIVATDPSLIGDLEDLLEPKGDPMSLLLWTTQSLVHLVSALATNNHVIKETALRRVLTSLGFSLKGNKKNIEGVSHPDRDLQFRHIKTTCTSFEQKGSPVISVDRKKKELIGDFKNTGK